MSENKDCKFYPNPFENEMVIEVPTGSKVTITNILGVVIFEEENAKHVNTSTWSKGVYVVKVKQERREVVRKVVKE